MVNFQPYTALFVFVFMAATLHFSFFKGFYYNLFPSFFSWNYVITFVNDAHNLNAMSISFNREV